jgi:hypothetical protein
MSDHFNLWLFCIVLTTHLYALIVFGSTFWIDSKAYVGLGLVLTDGDKLAEFYQSTGLLIFAHLGPGTPIIVRLLQYIPEGCRWPVLVIFQHGMAAFSIFFAFSTCNRFAPTRWHLLTSALLCLLPFYQSFHNALLTESLTSSLLLLSLSLALRITLSAPFSRWDFFCLVTVMVMIQQFRSYYGLLTAGLGLTAILGHMRYVPKRNIALFVGAALIGSLMFPAFRYFQIGKFFLPSGGINSLMAALWANPHPGNDVSYAFSRFPFPSELSAKDVLALPGGLDYQQAERLGDFWLEQGLSPAQINRICASLATSLLNDNLDVFSNRVRYALISSGFPLLGTIGPERYEVFRGMTLKQFRDHVFDHYRWISWIRPGSYHPEFESFFNNRDSLLPTDTAASQEVTKVEEPYLSTIPVRFRDPLLLGSLPMDLWAALGLLSSILLLRQQALLGLLFLIPFCANFAVMFSFPFGNPRYAYPLIPMFFLATSMFFGKFRTPSCLH